MDDEGGEPEDQTPLLPGYPEDFVTNDAVYTVRSVDFVPAYHPRLASLFDDLDEAASAWNRAKDRSVAISAATEATLIDRARKAKEILDKMAAPDTPTDPRK